MGNSKYNEAGAVNLQCSCNAAHNRRFMKMIYYSNQAQLEGQQHKHVYCVFTIVYLHVNVEEGLNTFYHKRSDVIEALWGGPLTRERRSVG